MDGQCGLDWREWRRACGKFDGHRATAIGNGIFDDWTGECLRG